MKIQLPKIPAALRFDGHGINDSQGQRLATFVESGKDQANAGLGKAIAATSDLLEALKFMLQCWQGDTYEKVPTDDGYSYEEIPCLTAAKAALAKAGATITP